MRNIVLWLVALLLVVPSLIFADEVYGPTAVGTNVTRPPVQLGAAAYPSPGASPVAQGKADRLTTDGTGILWTRLVGTITTSGVSSASATATGLATYCQPSFAGGSSEATVSPSPSNLYTFSASNPNTTDVYLTFWDASNPTPGTTAPTACYCIPAGLGASNRGWRDEAFTPPITFSTAMTVTVVSAANGSGTPTTPVSLTLGYK